MAGRRTLEKYFFKKGDPPAAGGRRTHKKYFKRATGRPAFPAGGHTKNIFLKVVAPLKKIGGLGTHRLFKIFFSFFTRDGRPPDRFQKKIGVK